MTAVPTIDHPTRCKPVQSASFAAFGGVAPNSPRVRCVLKDRSGTIVHEGAVLRGPPDYPYWVALFLNVPLQRDPYSVELWAVQPSAPLAVASGIHIRPLLRGTGISYPSTGDNVPSQFTAYGTTDRTNISGEMVNGGASFPGTLYQSQNFWGLVFDVLGPSGPGWTLNVNDDQASPAAQVDNLTVS